MFILSTMHLIKMVRLHLEQPFPSFSSAQCTKAIRERSGIFHFVVFEVETTEIPKKFGVFLFCFLNMCQISE